MEIAIEGTPTSLVRDVNIYWRLELEIYPIKACHLDDLIEKINELELLEFSEANFVRQRETLTSLVIESKGYLRDMCLVRGKIIELITEVIDNFADQNGGYEALKA